VGTNVACALELDGMSLRVDPLVGGRVVSLRCGDFELLSGQEADPDNYGSTFWTSPQADWGWPPPEKIDRGRYSFDAEAARLTLGGAADSTLGVRVIKRFTADRERSAFVLEYTVVNAGTEPRTYAPWEVTRVRPRGLTFFAERPRKDRLDSTWLAHEPAVLPAAGRKTFARETGGMLAYATEGYLFVKAFEPVPAPVQAPGEAAIEVYANHRYVELEVQGRYERIEPGGAFSWSVTWYLRKLPPNVVAIAGNASLFQLATQLVRG
jgi:hypothetical protein